MIFSKRTLPSTPGGLMNPDFVYINAVNTNVAATFRKFTNAQRITAGQVKNLAIAFTPTTQPKGAACQL